jgi:hypothetical protein
MLPDSARRVNGGDPMRGPAFLIRLQGIRAFQGSSIRSLCMARRCTNKGAERPFGGIPRKTDPLPQIVEDSWSCWVFAWSVWRAQSHDNLVPELTAQISGILRGGLCPDVPKSAQILLPLA